MGPLLYTETLVDDDNGIAQVNHAIAVHIGNSFVKLGRSLMQRIVRHHDGVAEVNLVVAVHVAWYLFDGDEVGGQ